jgi:hypothetical protein
MENYTIALANAQTLRFRCRNKHCNHIETFSPAILAASINQGKHPLRACPVCGAGWTVSNNHSCEKSIHDFIIALDTALKALRNETGAPYEFSLDMEFKVESAKP